MSVFFVIKRSKVVIDQMYDLRCVKMVSDERIFPQVMMKVINCACISSAWQ